MFLRTPHPLTNELYGPDKIRKRGVEAPLKCSLVKAEKALQANTASTTALLALGCGLRTDIQRGFVKHFLPQGMKHTAAPVPLRTEAHTWKHSNSEFSLLVFHIILHVKTVSIPTERVLQGS